jgi:subtilisin family serine protease
MRRTAWLLFALVVGCAGPKAESASRPEQSVRQLQPGQIIVVLPGDDAARSARVRGQLAAEYQLREMGAFPLGSIEVDCVVFQVESGAAVSEVLERLQKDPRVQAAQSNETFQGLSQGGARSTAALAYGPALIHADAAHRTRTGKGIKIAIVDTGVAADHPGLRGRIAASENFVDGGQVSFGRDRHGTAVAGVIAARDGDYAGMAPDAEVLALKACWYPEAESGKALCSSWTLAKAVDYAIRSGARVLNLSLGGPPDALLSRLLNRALERGTIVVAAAADGGAPGFPASLPMVIAVFSCGTGGQAEVPGWTSARFAIAAPGIDILTTVPLTGYDFVSGSSLAAAHVTGVVALLLEEDANLRPAQALELLRATSRPLAVASASTRQTAGLVDACAALGKLTGRSSCL